MPSDAHLSDLATRANANEVTPLHIQLPQTTNFGQDFVFRNAELPEFDSSGQVDLTVLYAIAKQYTPEFDILPDQNLVLKVVARNKHNAIVAQVRAGTVVLDGTFVHIDKPLSFMWGYGLNFDVAMHGAGTAGDMLLAVGEHLWDSSDSELSHSEDEAADVTSVDDASESSHIDLSPRCGDT